MFDLINGVPVHPLVVHAVVVLLPIACLGTIAIVLRPSWRQRYGVLVVAAAAIATVLLPVATSSGEALEERVGSPGEHAEMGDQLIWFTIPLLIAVAAIVWLDRKQRARTEDAAEVGSRPGRTLQILGVVAVIAALAASVQVYRVGDSGAKAAWGDRVASGSGD